MKICWCHSHFGEGGGPITLLTWAKGLRALGCEVEFVGEGGRLAPQVRDQGFPLHLLGGSGRPSLKNVWRYALLARRAKADILIGVGTFAGMEAALAAYLLRKPILFILNVSPRQSMWPTSPGWRFPRVGPAVVVNSQFGEMCVRNYGWPRKWVHHIPQRIELSSYLEIETCGSEALGRICFLRRLDSLKALDVVRTLTQIGDVLDRWPQVSITVAGNGEAREDVERVAAGINRRVGRLAVSCGDYVDNVVELLQTHSVVLGSERCAIEALAAGRTTFVISDAGGPWRVKTALLDHLAQDNFIGWGLAERGIAKSSAEEVLRASLQADSVEAARHRTWIQGRYSSHIGSETLYDLLASLVERKQRPKRPLEYARALLWMHWIQGRDFCARRLALRRRDRKPVSGLSTART